jgi:transcriptional regulator with XRE-family HTH domain
VTGPEPAAPEAVEPEAFHFGENLLRIRKARGMTHRDLSEAAGVSPSWISNLEGGKVTNPGVYLVYRLALVLAVPMEELMGVSRLSGRTRMRRRTGLGNSPENADTIGDDNSMPGDAGE